MLNEDQIMEWMRKKVKTEGFKDAASLAEQFLKTHNISNALDPDFSMTMDAGFKIAQEVHGF